MKKVVQILLFFLILAGVSCTNQEQKTRKIELRAEKELQELSAAVLANNMDSVWLVSRQSSDIHYLIFYNGHVVFWSDNSLTSPNIYSPREGGWHDFDFSNTRCRVRWQKVGDFVVEAIIPLEWNIDAKEEIEESFSYQPLTSSSSHFRARIFFWLMVATSLALVITGAVMMVRAGGYRNLRLRSKVSLAFMMVILVTFIALTLVSERYIQLRYRERQETILIQKASYIQAMLQLIYIYDYSTVNLDPVTLNSYLRDMAHTFETDIHVYDLKGELLGSSTPQLFNQRLLSTYIAPEVIFSPDKSRTYYSSLGDYRYLSAYTEFYNTLYIQLGYIAIPFFISEDDMMQQTDKFLAWLLPVYILVLIIGVVLAIGLSRVLTADFDARYNHMVQELERSSQELARHEREKAWRIMARQIAHEIKNPLTPMKLTVQQLQRLKGTDKFDKQFDQATNMLVTQIDGLAHIASSFSTFSQQPEVQPGQVDVAQKLSSVILLCANNPQGTPIRYFGPDSGVMVRADKEQISQVFTNIIRNAVQAINAAPDGDIIVILKDDGKNPFVEISISDNGPGIPKEVQPKIFLPNFTTKSNGTGLGLAISRHIVEAADGTLTFETSSNGTTFHIYLLRV